jgi:hypothetical protein
MLLKLLRTKQTPSRRPQEPRLRIEELSSRLMLSGDGVINPPTPPPPALADMMHIMFE